jgi:putative two-component system response regulator
VIALTHHEHFDGSGYPNHLSGSEIPFVGRIAAIADVFDALTSRRPYKSAFPTQKAIDIMLEGRGKQFDPSALDLFLRSLDQVLEIRDENGDRMVSSPRGTLVTAGG